MEVGDERALQVSLDRASVDHIHHVCLNSWPRVLAMQIFNRSLTYLRTKNKTIICVASYNLYSLGARSLVARTSARTSPIMGRRVDIHITGVWERRKEHVSSPSFFFTVVEITLCQSSFALYSKTFTWNTVISPSLSLSFHSLRLEIHTIQCLQTQSSTWLACYFLASTTSLERLSLWVSRWLENRRHEERSRPWVGERRSRYSNRRNRN